MLAGEMIGEVAIQPVAVDERGRRPAYTGARAADAVSLHPLVDRIGAPVRIEATEVETEALGALPEVRIVDPAAVGVKRVAHLPERALQPGRLGRRVECGRTGMLGGHREVTEAELNRQVPDPRPAGGAVRTAEVGVEDHLRSSPSCDMVIGPDRGHRGAGQLAHPSKLAPGIRVATPGRSTRRR